MKGKIEIAMHNISLLIFLSQFLKFNDNVIESCKNRT